MSSSNDIMVIDDEDLEVSVVSSQGSEKDKVTNQRFAAIFSVCFLAGLGYWAYDIASRDVAALPVVRGLSEDHPLKVALKDDFIRLENEEKARVAAARIEDLDIAPALRPDALKEDEATEIAARPPVAIDEPLSVEEGRAALNASQANKVETVVVEPTNFPMPILKPDSLADPMGDAIMSALQTIKEEEASDGQDTSLRPVVRPQR